MDEAFGLAIGLGRIGLGADVLEAKALAGFAEGKGFVAGAVVRHDTLDRYPEARIVGDGRLEEGDSTSLFLVLHDLTEGNAGSVVDADMHVLPARPLATGAQVALAGSIAGDAMADPTELAELFDVDVNQLTRMFALIAAHRFSRFQITHPVQSQPPQDPADSRRRHTDLGSNMLAGVALPAQRLDHRARGGRCLAWQ